MGGECWDRDVTGRMVAASAICSIIEPPPSSPGLVASVRKLLGTIVRSGLKDALVGCVAVKPESYR